MVIIWKYIIRLLAATLFCLGLFSSLAHATSHNIPYETRYTIDRPITTASKNLGLIKSIEKIETIEADSIRYLPGSIEVTTPSTTGTATVRDVEGPRPNPETPGELFPQAVYTRDGTGDLTYTDVATVFSNPGMSLSGGCIKPLS